MSSLRFWVETEKDVAKNVNRLPQSIHSTESISGEWLNLRKEELSHNLYKPLRAVLESRSIHYDDFVNQFKYQEISLLKVKSKDSNSSDAIELTLLQLNYADLNYFFLVDREKNVAAYVRFADNKNSNALKNAYEDNPFTVIDAIESFKRGQYSLGSILIQAVFEHSLDTSSNGRMSVISVSETGQFYFKHGFTSLNENTFDKMFYQNENVNGGIMFLTDSAIQAWKERASTHPLLPNKKQHAHQY